MTFLAKRAVVPQHAWRAESAGSKDPNGWDPSWPSGSASVFPDSSRVNPQLTIMALSLRLADHLAELLGGQRDRSGEAKIEMAG